MKKLLLSLGLLITFNGLSQQTVIETMGTTATGTTAIASNTFALSGIGFTYTGSGEVRITTVSTGYAGASGGSNVFLTNTTAGRDFKISNINGQGTPCSSIDLSFGVFKNTAATPNNDLTFEYTTSSNPTPVVTVVSITGGSAWSLKSFPGLPGNINTLRFINTTTTSQFRIDDITLVGNGTGCSLPVTLISFKATLNERQQATLKWATASEFNNDFFEIERSKNATDFESLGKIVGRGTVQGQNDYTFTDEVPLKGINYYRLKQVDFDGQFSYSRLSSVIKDGDGTISLFPNPTANVLKINFEDADQIENVTFYNAFGRVVKTVSGKQDKYEVADLPTGKYILQIRLADGREVRNVFLKN
jgi:hypothetical protein